MFKRSCFAFVAVLGLFAAPASANILIVPTFDSSITSDSNAGAIEGAINAAISQIDSLFSDPITVPILFQEGGGLGSSDTSIYEVSYSAYRAALVADAKSTDDATAVAQDLPAQINSPVDSQANMWLTAATMDAVGLAHGSLASYGTISLNTSITNFTRPGGNGSFYDLQGVAMHEIDEVLGLGSGLNLPSGFPRLSRPQDLFRYSAAGVRSFTTATGSSYFSIDSGTTNLVNFHQTADGADFGDWASSGAAKVQDAFGSPGSIPTYGVEVRNLDVIGFDLASVPEPGTLTLLGAGLGLICLGRVRRRLRKS